MSKKGGGGQTTTSSSAPPPQVMANYEALTNRAQQVASTPYQAYGGQMVADLSPTQQQGIQSINAAQGMAQPYINQASALANQSAQPVWQNIPQYNDANLQKYQSPYTQNVIDTTMANINQNNAIQQQGLLGHAIASGASPFGGDRAGVAAGELARQQNLASGQTIAGLENQGFQNAQNQFTGQQQLQLQGQNLDAQRAAQAASIQGGLGLTAQGAALQGGMAQLQAGGLQQQQQQAGLNAAYQQFQQQQAFPYQQTQWLGNIEQGLGSNSGGTSTTTQPGQSAGAGLAAGALAGGATGYMIGGPMGAGIGAGLGGVASFFKDGGAIPHYASGGSPYDTASWIPTGNLSTGHTIPSAPQIAQKESSNAGSAMGLLSSMGKSGQSGQSDGLSLGDQFGATKWGNSIMNGGAFHQGIEGLPWLQGGSTGSSDSSPTIDMSTYNNGGAYGSNYGQSNDWAGLLGSKDGGRIKRNYGGLIPHYDDGGVIDPTMDEQGDTYQIASENIPALGYTMASNIPNASRYPNLANADSTSTIPDAPQTGLIAPGSQDITPSNNPGLAVASQNPQVETDKPSIPMALLAVAEGISSSNSPRLGQSLVHGLAQGAQNYGQQKQAILAAQKEKQLEQHQQNMDNKPQIVSDGEQMFALYPSEKDATTGKPKMIPLGIPDKAAGLNKAKLGLIKAQTESYKDTSAPGGLDASGQIKPDNGIDLPKTETGQIDISKVSPEVMSQAQAYIDGRQLLPTGMQAKQPLYRQALAIANQLDPQLDTATSKTRVATQREFKGNGAAAKNITALNTGIHHVNQLLDDSAALNNTRYGWVNDIKNPIMKAAGSDSMQKALKNVNMDANAVAGELAKVFRSTGMSEKDIDSWKKEVSSSNTPVEFQAAAEKAIGLMEGRLSALGQQYNQGMGKASDPLELLSPEAQGIWNKIKGTPGAKLVATGTKTLGGVTNEANTAPQPSPQPNTQAIPVQSAMPPLESRIPGQTVYKGHTWGGSSWLP